MKQSKDIEQSGISRRGFLKGGAAAMALSAGASVFAVPAAYAVVPADASDAKKDSTFPHSIDEDPYFAKPDAITDISETADYDVVVIGAGAAGVPAACAAADNGASVAVLQKSPRVYSHGILWSGWNTPTMIEEKGGVALTDEQINELKADFMEQNHFGTQTGLLNTFFDMCPEAMEWQIQEIKSLGLPRFAPPSDNPLQWNYMIPTQTSAAYQAFADDYEQNKGVEFFYSTPAMQLVQADDGTVTGVIAQDRDGNYIQLNAAKGVVIATGGYGANKDLIARWIPECINLTNGCYPPDNTGDGALMAIWAGADASPLKSKKIDIRFYGTNAARTNIEKIAFLLVNDKGQRMGNEASDEMQHNNFINMNPSESGKYYCIFDGNYGEWLTSIEKEDAILTDEDIAEYEDFSKPLLWKADTIEELAGMIDVDPESLKATADRYSELAKNGADTDFYKDAQYLYDISTPPFYAMIREYTIGGTLGAIKVNDECNAVSRTGEPIPGLYVVGNDMGGLQTGQDYVWHDYGFTLCTATTFGYMVGKNLAIS